MSEAETVPRKYAPQFSRQGLSWFRRPGVMAALLGLLSLAVYVRTLCVSIAWGDSPELTTAAYFAGVPHPTGYPTYMLLGHAFLRCFPFGSIAYRMNLLSALSAAAAVALLFLVAFRLTRSRPAALAAALLFAFSRTFWSQAVIAEVYAFHLLLTAATLLAVLEWDRTGSRRWLAVTALVYGLSFTHHLMSVLVAPALVVLAATSKHRGAFARQLFWTLPLFLLPLLLYLYLPWAAHRDPPANWGDPRTWQNFLDHVSGRQYRTNMFSKDLAELATQFGKYAAAPTAENPGFLLTQFPPALLALGLLGALSMLRRRPRWLAVTALVYAVNVLYSINYDIYDIEVYYLVSHLVVALWIGYGLRLVGVWLALLWKRVQVAPSRRKTLGLALSAALLMLPGSSLASNWAANDKSQDWTAHTYARAALQALKPNAVLIAAGDNPYFPLLYVRYVERRRTDVTIVSIYNALLPERLRLTTRLKAEGLRVNPPDCYLRAPRGFHTDNCLLTQIVADNYGHRPLYVLAPDDTLEEPWMKGILDQYAHVTTTNVPFFELRKTPPSREVELNEDSQPAAAFDPHDGPRKDPPGLELLAYDVAAEVRDGVPWYRLKYLWRVNDPELGKSAVARVLFADAEGNYPTRPDGVPEFHNNHHLGQVRGAKKRAQLPHGLLEEFEVYVPPAQWGKELHLWVGVLAGDELMRARGQDRPYVRVGTLPVLRGALEGAIDAEPSGVAH